MGSGRMDDGTAKWGQGACHWKGNPQASAGASRSSQVHAKGLQYHLQFPNCSVQQACTRAVGSPEGQAAAEALQRRVQIRPIALLEFLSRDQAR